MGAPPEVACVCVWDGEPESWPEGQPSRYALGQLKSALQLMGCKTLVAHKASKSTFRMLQEALLRHLEGRQAGPPQPLPCLRDFQGAGPSGAQGSGSGGAPQAAGLGGRPEPHGQPPWLSSKQREAGLTYLHFPAALALALRPADVALREGGGGAVVSLRREAWGALVMEQVASLTDRLLPLGDFALACSVREQRRSVTVLLAGTSGTGKSTLAGLLAARLGIATVVSTDSLRHLLRSFTPREAAPVLWASTYEAGAVVLARQQGAAGQVQQGAPAQPLSPDEAAIKGYKEQAELVARSLGGLVEGCERRGESLVVEGVHLSLNAVLRLMRRHPSIVPFLVHISNEAKHRERFAVRAKYMALAPAENRYVAHLPSIRTIQAYLLQRAARHAVPALDNTNVDRSVATLHATVMGCLRRQAAGESLLDAGGKTCRAVLGEFAKCRDAGPWGSKGMLELIRRKAEAAAASQAAPAKPWGEGPHSELASRAASSTIGPMSDAGDSQSGVSMAWDGISRTFFALEDPDDLLTSDDEASPQGAAQGGKGWGDAEPPDPLGGGGGDPHMEPEGSVSHLEYEGERSGSGSEEGSDQGMLA